MKFDTMKLVSEPTYHLADSQGCVLSGDFVQFAQVNVLLKQSKAYDDLVEALKIIAAGHGCPSALATDVLAKVTAGTA